MIQSVLWFSDDALALLFVEDIHIHVISFTKEIPFNSFLFYFVGMSVLMHFVQICLEQAEKAFRVSPVL